MSLAQFGNTAKKLTHNPLGIIALFIVLVYAFASLVVGFGGSLDQSQKTPMVWFLVLFPVLVLLVFAWLVSRHHMKLYAPTDYRDEKLFIYPISLEDQRQRLLEEAKDIETQEPEIIPNIEHQPEETISHVPIKTRERLLSISGARSSAASKYLLAEDLALRQLETELRTPIVKQIEIIADNFRLMCDGLIRDGQKLTIVEVKYVSKPMFATDMVQSVLFRFIDLTTRVKLSNKDATLGFIFVFVTEFSGEELERFKSRILGRLNTTAIPLEWRFYSIEELKERFGITAAQA